MSKAPTVPLLMLLGGAWCEKSMETTMRNLCETPEQRRQLQALIDLWKSLGEPGDGFWQALLVDYNRMDRYSSDEKANAVVSHGD